MKSIIEAAISRGRAVTTLLVFIFIAGLTAYQAIPKEANPDVAIPMMYVSMTLDGISPEDAERLLVRPMEHELRSLEGIKKMTGIASEGHASILLEFDAGFDADKALQDVRVKVDDGRAKLPGEADEPSVNEINVALFPVLSIGLAGPVSEAELVYIARRLQENMEGIAEVLEVDIGGDREDLLEIVVNPQALDSYGIDYLQLQSTILITRQSFPREDIAFIIATDTLGNPIDTLKALMTVRIRGFVDDGSGQPMTDFNGLAIPMVYDKEQTTSTLANDGGSPFVFDIRKHLIYRGKASVVNGEFELTFVVPSGNLGNLTAGLMATGWAGAEAHFVAAHNRNDYFARFLAGQAAAYEFVPSVTTLSNAMDVGAPSNFERLFTLFGERLPARVVGEAVDDAATLDRMRLTYERHGYLACPHTAVGLEAWERVSGRRGQGGRAIVLATAFSSGMVGDSLTVLERHQERIRAGLQVMTVGIVAVASLVVTAVAVGADADVNLDRTIDLTDQEAADGIENAWEAL